MLVGIVEGEEHSHRFRHQGTFSIFCLLIKARIVSILDDKSFVSSMEFTFLDGLGAL